MGDLRLRDCRMTLCGIFVRFVALGWFGGVASVMELRAEGFAGDLLCNGTSANSGTTSKTLGSGRRHRGCCYIEVGITLYSFKPCFLSSMFCE
jgi:hypothetical protein